MVTYTPGKNRLEYFIGTILLLTIIFIFINRSEFIIVESIFFIIIILFIIAMYAQDIWGFQIITITEDQLILKNLFRRKEIVIWLDEIDKVDISEIIFGDENGVLGRYPRVEICYERKNQYKLSGMMNKKG